MNYLQPKDIIAIILIMVVAFLLFNGVEGPISEAIALIVGYYFGHRKTGQDDGL